MSTIKTSLLVLGCGAFVAYVIWSQRESDKRYEALSLKLVELKRTVSSSEPRILPPQIVRVVERIETEEDPPTKSAGEALAPSAEKAARTDQDVDDIDKPAIASGLRDFISREVNDRSWSVGAEKKVAEVFAAKLPEGSMVKSLNCRSTMCLVEMQHKTLDAFQQFVNQTLLHPSDGPIFGGPATAFVVDKQGSGELSVVVALARKGFDLPPPE